MSGIGLATKDYQLPEGAAASDFDQSARAVATPPAAPPQPSGIGLAAPPAPDAAAAPAPVPAAAPAAAPEAAPAPAPAGGQPALDIHKNPLFTIGMLLTSFAAGVRGTKDPLDEYRAQQIEAQAQQYKTASLALDVIDKTSAFVAKLPADQRGHAIADMDQRFAPALGGHSIAPFLTALSAGTEEKRAATMNAIKALSPSPAMMGYFASNPDAAIKFLDGYADHQATKETPEEAAAKAGAVADAQNKAGATKPMTPAEKAAHDLAVKNSNIAAGSAAETERHNHVDEAAAANKPLTTDQSNAATFADRAHEAEAVLSKHGKALTSLKDASLEYGGAAGRAVQSSDYQQASQAKTNFLMAVLRKESGAAIGKDEIETGDKQYFAQPGDKPAVIAQKARNRATAIAGMERAAGPTYQRPRAVIQYDAQGKRIPGGGE